MSFHLVKGLLGPDRLAALALAAVLAACGAEKGPQQPGRRTTGAGAPAATGALCDSAAPTGGASTSTRRTGAANAAGAGGPGRSLAAFAVDPAVTDARKIWHIDFDALGDRFFAAMVGHGLGVRSLGRDHPLNRAAFARIACAVLQRVCTAYERNPDGTGRPGSSFDLTFVGIAPDPARFPGGAGTDYSSICLGSRQTTCTDGVLGAQYLDPGNLVAEWICTVDRIGVFAGRICGENSTLGGSPGGPARLSIADLQFVDGSYFLGRGSEAEDRRFLEVDAALADWGTALGNVVAHEIGHALGLEHDRRRGHLMQAVCDAQDLSDATLAFSAASRRVLARDVGYAR